VGDEGLGVGAVSITDVIKEVDAGWVFRIPFRRVPVDCIEVRVKRDDL
jgi:hypothetical protein